MKKPMKESFDTKLEEAHERLDEIEAKSEDPRW
jgi:tetrahydromethanopterin S-methyltransferase subunit G